MKAAICTTYGAPSVLKIETIIKPELKKDEVLVKLHATAVTSGDARMRRADPFIMRLVFGFTKPRNPILGIVLSGEVVAVGKHVTKFKIGDEVYGSSGMKFGAHAEYAAVSENGVIALKPYNLTYAEAASIPFGGTASMHFIRKALLQPNQKILIYGASGALGVTAIQIAKYIGAHVTAVCSKKNEDLVRSLGADEVIDYNTTDVVELSTNYHVVYDTVGKLSSKKALKILEPNGTVLMANASIGSMLYGGVNALFGQQKIISGVIKETAEDLYFFKRLLEEKKMVPVIDSTYKIEEIQKAHTKVDEGHKRGSVIVTFS